MFVGFMPVFGLLNLVGGDTVTVDGLLNNQGERLSAPVEFGLRFALHSWFSLHESASVLAARTLPLQPLTVRLAKSAGRPCCSMSQS